MAKSGCAGPSCKGSSQRANYLRELTSASPLSASFNLHTSVGPIVDALSAQRSMTGCVPRSPSLPRPRSNAEAMMSTVVSFSLHWPASVAYVRARLPSAARSRPPSRDLVRAALPLSLVLQKGLESGRGRYADRTRASPAIQMSRKVTGLLAIWEATDRALRIPLKREL